MKKLEIEIKSNISKKDEVNKRLNIAEIMVEQVKDDYDLLIKETVKESFEGKVNPDKVTKILSKAKELSDAERILKDLNDTITSTSSNRGSKKLSETTKEKIYYYHKTGDFTQEQISKIFNTTQATVSRIISNKKGEE